MNGRSLEVQADEQTSAQSLRPRLGFPLSGDDTVELRFIPGPEIVIPEVRSATGDASAGLRLVRSRLSGRDLDLSFEGRTGETYTVEVLNGERIESVGGAVFEGCSISLAFPPGPERYTRGEVTLKLQ